MLPTRAPFLEAVPTRVLVPEVKARKVWNPEVVQEIDLEFPNLAQERTCVERTLWKPRVELVVNEMADQADQELSRQAARVIVEAARPVKIRADQGLSLQAAQGIVEAARH